MTAVSSVSPARGSSHRRPTNCLSQERKSQWETLLGGAGFLIRRCTGSLGKPPPRTGEGSFAGCLLSGPTFARSRGDAEVREERRAEVRRRRRRQAFLEACLLLLCYGLSELCSLLPQRLSVSLCLTAGLWCESESWVRGCVWARNSQAELLLRHPLRRMVGGGVSGHMTFWGCWGPPQAFSSSSSSSSFHCRFLFFARSFYSESRRCRKRPGPSSDSLSVEGRRPLALLLLGTQPTPGSSPQQIMGLPPCPPKKIHQKREIPQGRA